MMKHDDDPNWQEYAMESSESIVIPPKNKCKTIYEQLPESTSSCNVPPSCSVSDCE